MTQAARRWRRLLAEVIVAQAARIADVPRETLIGPEKSKALHRARCWAARKGCDFGLPIADMARALGRHPASVSAMLRARVTLVCWPAFENAVNDVWRAELAAAAPIYRDLGSRP